jgi:hypothetical protein
MVVIVTGKKDMKGLAEKLAALSNTNLRYTTLGLMPGLRCGKPSETRHRLRLVGAGIALWGSRATRFLLLCCPRKEPCNAVRFHLLDRIGQVSVWSRFLSRSFQFPLVIYCRRRDGRSGTGFARIHHCTNWNHSVSSCAETMKAIPGSCRTKTVIPKLSTDPVVSVREMLCEELNVCSSLVSLCFLLSKLSLAVWYQSKQSAFKHLNMCMDCDITETFKR